MTAKQDQPVAIVTGGASGIGFATVQRLVRSGHQVIAADMNMEVCDKAVATLGDKTAAVAARVDVRSEDDIARVIGEAMSRHGRLDVLVNNAGVGGAFGAVTDVAAEDWDFTFEVLVRGVFLGIKHAARVMKPGSAIVNVASVAAYSGAFGAMAYSAAKAAVINLTHSAAVELAPKGIRVNSVCPGVIRTPLMESSHPERLEGMQPPGQPMSRWGQPDDIASVIEFLAGPNSSFVTGAEIRADGGLVAAGPGPDFGGRIGVDPRARGLAGVNRGSTGEKSVIRKRPEKA